MRGISAYGVNSLQITFFRSAVTAVLLFLFLFLFDRRKLRVQWKDLWCFIGSGICSIVFFNFCYFQAIQMTSLSVAAILLYTAPIFVTILSAVLFHEKITRKKALALILAFFGCVLVTGVLGGSFFVSHIALLFGVGSGLGYALYSIFGRFALRKYHFLTVAAYTFLFASIGCFPLANFPELIRTVIVVPEMPWIVIALGTVTSAIPYALYTYGLNFMETGHASIISSIEPVMASLIGIVVYHEAVSVSSVTGSLLVLAAILLLNKQTR